jgi:hypothetical protein
LLLYFYDSSAPSLVLNRSLLDPELKPFHSQFGAARAPMKKGSAICLKYDVDRAPTILILNPQLPRPEETPLARITTSRSPRELRRDLEEALTAARSAGIVEAPATGKEEPAPVEAPVRKEILSDDEVDRKFIRARFDLAMELVKKGMKPKALEVLQDIVATFPKHVETVAVKKYIEELKQP